MEKLQKYCLSVILVIIYSNVSAHINTETAENIGCEKLRQLCNKLLSEDVDDSILFSNLNKESKYFELNQKHQTIHAVGKKNSKLQKNNTDSFLLSCFEFDKYDKALEDFEKQTKQNGFAEKIYFKSKFAKVRNKDDLDLKTRT